MSQYSSFLKELRSLQVMSPDTCTPIIACILKGPTSFKKWKRELERNIRFIYFPLFEYYKSSTNAITDNDGNQISDEASIENALFYYNAVLLGLLRVSVSSDIRNVVDSQYEDRVDESEHVLKDIIAYLDKAYGQLNFEAAFKMVSDFKNVNHVSDEEYADYSKAMSSVCKIDNLREPCFRLLNGTSHTKTEILRKYGALTHIDNDEFTFDYFRFQSHSPDEQNDNSQSPECAW